MILSRAVAAFSKLRVKLVARGVALRCVALRWGPDLALALHKVASQVYPLFHAFKVRFMKATSSVDFQKERLQSGRHETLEIALAGRLGSIQGCSLH